MIDYNIQNNIKMFRITSDLIPFGGSVHNQINWKEKYVEKFSKISKKIIENDIRISMHPGQYTVLNSPNEEVVQNSIRELEYHADILDLLCKNSDIILHIGGVYGNKEEAMERFVQNFQKLDKKIVEKLIIENDDKSYTVENVLEISKRTKIPVVFDNLHHEVNPSFNEKTENEVLEMCLKTWNRKPKIHYSNQDENKKTGSHSKRIDIDKFIEFTKKINKDIDIMLEVKDKNLSAIKCINILNSTKKGIIYEEWSRYKYKVLENSHKNYLEIRELLKTDFSNIEFYKKIDEALEKNKKNSNALNHVYGHFKKIATEKELKNIQKLISEKEYEKAKNQLEKLTIKYNEPYLIKSYYFLD